MINKTTVTKQVILDNFAPYVEEVKLFYTDEKELPKDATGTYVAQQESISVFLQIQFSENMSEDQPQVFLNGTLGSFGPYNGVWRNPKVWLGAVPLVSCGECEISIDARDLEGNLLDGMPNTIQFLIWFCIKILLIK